MIPTGKDEDGVEVKESILKKHGDISMAMIKKYEKTYSHKKTRQRHDLLMLYNCIMDTLSMVGRTKILEDREKYIIPWTAGDEIEEDAHSGNLLLKLVLTKTIVDNRSGPYAVRQALSDLVELIGKCKWNIEKFNEQVKALLEELGYRGETSKDTLFNLFKAYKMVPVQAF